MGKTFVDSKRQVVCFFLPSASLDRPQFEALATACYRFSPQIAIRFPEAIFLNIRGCEGLFSEQGLRARLSVLGKKFLSCSTQIRFAEDAPTALALARYPFSSEKRELPLEALSDFDLPFGTPEKQKPEPKVYTKEFLDVLHKLGLKNLGDFMNLPYKSLAARVGKKGVEISAKLRGDLEIPWPRFCPPEKISETLYLEEEVQLESVFFVLKGMMDRTMSRLRGLAKRASRISLELQVRKFSTLSVSERVRRWEIELAVPQGSTSSLLGIVKERIYFEIEKTPLGAPVEEITFEILETVPGRGSQFDFFDSKEEDQEKWDSLVGRLVDQLGRENVFLAHPVARYFPEKNWIKKLEPSSFAETDLFIAQVADRPLRVLKKPELLKFANGILKDAEGRPRRVVHSEGPERISPEWWLESSEGTNQKRDYYKLTLENGQRVWVFISEGLLFLHGYFD